MSEVRVTIEPIVRAVAARLMVAVLALALVGGAPARPSTHARTAVHIGAAAHLTNRDVLA